MAEDLSSWQFQLLVGDLAKMDVFVPLEGHEAVELTPEKLKAVRASVRPDALGILEKLVGMGAFGVHDPLSYEEQDVLRAKLVERLEIAELAEDAYKRLRAAEQARSRLLDEKVARVQARAGGERLVTGGTVFDEPDQVAAVWGVGNYVLRAAGQGTMIASQQGLGKTTVAQQMVLHRIGVRTGGFLGYPVTPVGDGEAVLYLAADRPTQAMGSFRRMVVPESRRAPFWTRVCSSGRDRCPSTSCWNRRRSRTGWTSCRTSTRRRSWTSWWTR